MNKIFKKLTPILLSLAMSAVGLAFDDFDECNELPDDELNAHYTQPSTRISDDALALWHFQHLLTNRVPENVDFFDHCANYQDIDDQLKLIDFTNPNHIKRIRACQDLERLRVVIGNILNGREDEPLPPVDGGNADAQYQAWYELTRDNTPPNQLETEANQTEQVAETPTPVVTEQVPLATGAAQALDRGNNGICNRAALIAAIAIGGCAAMGAAYFGAF